MPIIGVRPWWMVAGRGRRSPVIFNTRSLSGWQVGNQDALSLSPDGYVKSTRTSDGSSNHEILSVGNVINGNIHKFIRLKINKPVSLYSDTVHLRFGVPGTWKSIFTIPSLTLGINDRIIDTSTATVSSGSVREDYYNEFSVFRIYQWAIQGMISEVWHVGFYSSLEQLEQYRSING